MKPRAYRERVWDTALRIACEHLNPEYPEAARTTLLSAAVEAVPKPKPCDFRVMVIARPEKEVK
jgi:hypothetical protein